MSDNLRKLSDSQDLAVAMIERVKRESENQEEQSKIKSYSFIIKQFVIIYPLHAPEKQSDTLHDLLESGETAIAMIGLHRQRQVDPPQAPSVSPEAANDNTADIERAKIERLKEQQRQAREQGPSRGGYRRQV